MNRWQLVSTAFLELADTITDDFNPIDFFQTLVGRTAEIFQADASALLLSDLRGNLRVVASTDHRSAALQALSLSGSGGQSREVFLSSTAAINLHPGEALQRWPTATQAALSAGYATTHVVPMSIRREVLGTLTLAFAGTHRLGKDDHAIVQSLASVATIGLLHERTTRQSELLAVRMQSALALRASLEQAKGLVAESLGVDVAVAFRLLKDHAQQTSRSLSGVVAELLTGTLAADDLTDGGADHTP